MLVVKIELWSAITGKRQEIGRMYIANDGSSGNPKKGNYNVKVARKNSKDYKGWEKISHTREGKVLDYPRLSYNVWRLILRSLKACFPEEK